MSMTVYDATLIAEGAEKASSEEQYFEAWQTLIDTGEVWGFEGAFVRHALLLIEERHCTMPTIH